MKKLCKDCDCYKIWGFSSVCKYCKNDGGCPECGAPLGLGNDLDGPMYICPNGHCFDVYGREFFRELLKK